MSGALAQGRPRAVSRDEGDAPLFQPTVGGAGGDRDPVFAERKILDPYPEMKSDIGMGAYRVEQHGLQVAAMKQPVGRAVALLGDRTERRALEHTRRLRVHDPQHLRREAMLSREFPERTRKQT